MGSGITARKKIEKQLHFQANLLQNVSDAIIASDLEFKITRWNAAAEAIYGWHENEVIGKLINEILQTEFINDDQQNSLKQLFEQGKWNGEVTQINKNGRPIQIHASVTLIKDSHGQITGFVALNRDITQNKLTEEALRKSEERFERIVNATNDAVWDWNFATNSVWWNEGIRLIFGYNADEVGSDSEWWIEHLHPDDRDRILTEVQRFIHSNENHWAVECRFTKANGTFAWVSNRGYIDRDDDGQAFRMVCGMADITKRKQAEFEIQRLNNELEQRVIERTTQLEAVNKELEAFSYSVSHDLRAPLRHIIGYANILQEDYTDKLNEEGKETLNVIIGSARKMGQLIDDLLEFSRMGRKGMDKEVVNMYKLVEEVSAELLAQEKDREINFKINQLEPTKADYQMIKQVWINLIANAIKYTRNKVVAHIETGCNLNDQHFCYYIMDNGAGFNIDYISKLFNVFQRLHSEEEFEGTGVGLALVKRIINRHGGEIWAEATENQGATFYFTLPKS